MTISNRATLPGLLWLVLAASLACSWAHAKEPSLRKFDLPADSAEQSLKRFSVQAGIEVVFATHVTQGVRTAALRGTFVPIDALRRLLIGTPLLAKPDERTGAIVVTRGKAPLPNG